MAEQPPVLSSKLHPNHKWWTLGTIALALFMILLDSNVVNLAIPRILGDFGASLSQVEWINNSYLLVFAVFLITFGRLGDEVGRKKMFMIGTVVFTIGSVLNGVSHNVTQLIAFRALQGLGGAMMMPATISIISATFEKRERGIAMGIWGAVAGLGIALGPIIGGNLTESGLGAHLNSFFHIAQFWRYVFYVNLPVGIFAFFMSWFIIRESRDSEATHNYDIVGILLSGLSIFSLTFGFIEGPKFGWWKVASDFHLFGQHMHFGSVSVIPALFALAVLLAVAFIAWEKRVKKDPLVDLNLFRSRNFAVGNVAAAILSFAMLGAFFLLPLFIQSILGYTPKHAGTVLLPLALTIMIAAPIAGRLSDKFGAKWGLVFGMSLVSVGLYLMAHFSLDTSTKALLIPFIVTGLGMGFALAPLTTITLLDIPPEEAGGASGVFSTARQIGSVMGIAILGAYLQSIMPLKMENHIKAIPNLPPVVQTRLADFAKSGGLTQASSDPKELQAAITGILAPTTNGQPGSPAVTTIKPAEMAKLGQEIGRAGKEGFTDAINQTLVLAAGIAVLGAATSLVFGNKKPEHPVESGSALV